MLVGRYSDDVGGCRRGRERTLGQRGVAGGVDEIPRGGDLTADEYAIGIDDVDYAAESESQISCGCLNGRNRLCIFGPSPRDQVVDGERRISRGRRWLRAPEIARERRHVRNVRLPAAEGATRAAGAVD